MLLAAIGLILVPLFYNRNQNIDELRLSANIPTPPAKPATLAVPSAVKNPPAPPQSGPGARIVFEELQSIAQNNDNPSLAAPTTPVATPTPVAVQKSAQPSLPAPKILATAEKPVAPILLTTTSPAPLLPLPEAESTVPKPSPAKQTLTTVATRSTDNDTDVDTDIDEDQEKTTVETSESTVVTPKPLKAATATKKAPVKTTKTTLTKSKPVTKSSKNTNGTPSTQAWAVQLGSFSDRINADKLMKTLQAKGFTAYTQMVKTSHGSSMTKVLVGPELHREDAEKVQQQLKTVSTSTMIVKAGP